MKKEFWNTREKQRKTTEDLPYLQQYMNVSYHFFPELGNKLNKVQDARHQSYVNYSPRTILTTRILAYMCGIESMNMINAMFNTETAVRNILKVSEQTQLS